MYKGRLLLKAHSRLEFTLPESNSLLAHSVGFVRRQPEIAIGSCHLPNQFFSPQTQKYVKIFKILTKSCLHFKVICLIFYQ